MLSIVVSTYKPDKFQQLQDNISRSIGNTVYELIKVDNPGLMGLCSAYNKGAASARYDVLLFIHDDIEFNTNNWGEILLHHIRRYSQGIIGIAGGNYVPAAPSGWFIKHGAHTVHSNQETKLLDGVFLAMSKEQYKEMPFNEQIKGYHGYDTEICTRSAIKYANLLVSDIQIIHHSEGNPDRQWLENHIQIRDLYGNSMQKKKNADLEEAAYLSFIKFYFKYYPVNSNNLHKVFKYYPYRALSFEGHYRIIRKIFVLLKYRKNLQ